MSLPYDLIVVGIERVGVAAARQVGLAGWSVLVAGFRALDGLARSGPVASCLQEQLQGEGLELAVGQARFVDRRIVEVSHRRYEGRQLLVSLSEFDGLNLAAAEVQIANGYPLVDGQSRSTSNPSVLFAHVAELPAGDLAARSVIDRRAILLAHTILGTASGDAVAPTRSPNTKDKEQ